MGPVHTDQVIAVSWPDVGLAALVFLAAAMAIVVWRSRDRAAAGHEPGKSKGATVDTAACRLVIVDRLRGLMIALMALDHVRDFFNRDAFIYIAEDLSRTTPAIFATRWMTHLCAPTFVLLAGVSVRLQQAAGKTGWPLSRHLLARGAWLIALELTLISLLFNFGWPFLFIQVIWAIGASMVLLAGAIWLPRGVTLALGVLIVAGGQAFGSLLGPALSEPPWLFTLLLQPGVLPSVPSFVAYPLLPWSGIMAVGYAAGGIALLPASSRDRLLVGIGVAMLAGFVMLRALNGYGNPSSWTPQESSTGSIMAFVNVAKYPPSLDYVLVTLGITLTIAPALAHFSETAARPLDAFGRAPFFTYILHILLIHLLAMAIGVASGLSPELFTDFIADPKRLAAAGWGVTLGATYGIWLAVLLALWPAAAWFARVKASRREWWLSYL